MATIGQRLVRVKAKIRDADIHFEVPGAHDLPLRLASVLEAIYAAYGSGWEGVAGADPRRQGLAEEAIWLGRLVARLVPDELDGMPSENVTSYQPYWVRGHLLKRLGSMAEAKGVFERAMALSQDPAVREFLRDSFDTASESA